MDALEQFEVDGLTVKIFQDEDAESPRVDYDNAGKMVCWHNRYTLGDKHTFHDPEGFLEWWKENGKGGILLPLFLYDHSGLTMSTREFSCPWDSGQVGFIYATKETILKEWGKGKKNFALAEEVLRGEVKTFDQYLTGDVYGYVVESPDGEHLDSCWGFYGAEYAKGEATTSAKHYAVGIKNAERMEKSAFAL